MKIILKDSVVKTGEARDYTFQSIDRGEYKILLDYLESKRINVVNPQAAAETKMDLGEDDDEDEEDDEDYNAPASSEDEDSGGSGSESGSDEGSGDEGSEAKPKKVAATETKKASKKRAAKESSDGGDRKRAKKEKKVKDKNAPKGATTAWTSFLMADWRSISSRESISTSRNCLGTTWARYE